MPFLKTLAKRADEPYRPEPIEPEAAAPAPAPAAGPAAGVSTDLPKVSIDLGEQEAPELPKVELPSPVDVGTLAENLEALDERQLLMAVAREGATEPIKAFREAERLRQQGADIKNIDRVQVLGYLQGEEVKDTYRTPQGEERPIEALFARSPVNIPEKQRKLLEERGQEVKVIRTFDDIATDVFSDALEAQYVEKAETRKAGRESYRADLQALTDSGFFEANAEARPTNLREAEKALARVYGRRMAGADAAQGVNLLQAVVRDAGTRSLNLVESTFFRRLGEFLPVTGTDDGDTDRTFEPFSSDEKLLAMDTTERALMLESEIEENIPALVISEAVKRNRAGTKPSFSDLRGFERPEVKALRGMTDSDRLFLAYGQDIGVRGDLLAGLAQAESGGRPNVVAFNLDNARKYLTPEQEAEVDRRLREKFGYEKPAGGGDEFAYGQEARQFLAEVAQVSPSAAVRATAFGLFQVLGDTGSGDFLGLAREVAKDKDLSDDEAAMIALSMFQQKPYEVSMALAKRWWSAHPELRDKINAGDLDENELWKLYSGGHTEDVRDAQGREGSNGVPDWLDSFRLGRSKASALTAMFEQPSATDTPAPEPTLFESGVELPPSVEAQQEAETLAQDLGALQAAGRFAADIVTPGSYEETLAAEQAAERELGIEFTRLPSKAIDLVALENQAWMPRAGTERYEVSTRTWRSIAQNAPERAQKLMDISQRAIGTGFDRVRQDVEAKYAQEVAAARRSGDPVDYQEIQRRINLEALDIITSMQVAGVWTSPVYVSFAQLMGREEPESWLEALSPRIEVLGRSGDEVIFRSESGGMALLNTLDAVPVIGQAYNVGVVENYMLPALGNRVDEALQFLADPSLQNATALGKGYVKMAFAFTIPGAIAAAVTGDLAELHQAGIRGVAGRANLAEFMMDSSFDIANTLVETAPVEATLEMLVDADLMPFIPDDMTTETRARVTAAKDVIRSASRLSALPAGMLFAVVHPDLLGGMVSAARGAKTAGRTLLALSRIENMLDPAVIGGVSWSKGLRMDGRQQLFAQGDLRLTATTTVINDMEMLATLAGDVDAADSDQVGQLLARLDASLSALSETDAFDASRRQVNQVLQERLDKLTAEYVAASAEAGRPEAAALVDKNLALRVQAVVEAVTANIGDISDPVRRAKAERLKELTNAAEGGVPAAYLTVEPGAARRVVPGVEVGAGLPFDTARRIEALRLAVELFDDVEDSFVIRKRVLQQRLDEPLGTWGRTPVDDLNLDMPQGVTEVTPLTAVDVFGAVTEAELEALPAFQRLSDADKARVRVSRRMLSDFADELKAAATATDFDASLMNPDVADDLFGRIKSSGIIDGDAYSQFIYRNRRSTVKGGQFNRAALALRAHAEAVSGSSTAQQDLFRGLAAVLSYNLHRGKATKDLARVLVDARALGVEEGASAVRRSQVVDAFLGADPRSTLGERMMSAVVAGTREGLVSLVGSMGMGPGTGSVAAARAKASQMTMDGSNPYEVARAMQNEVLRRLNARRQAAIEAFDQGVEAPESVEALEETITRVDTDEWRASLVDWMTRTAKAYNAAVDRGEAVQLDPFDLPVAIDTRIFSGGSRGYRVTKATRTFVKDSGFMTAYGYAGEEARDTMALGQRARTRKQKLSKDEREAAMTVLDQMVRFMAKVDPSDAPEVVETKMSDWYRQHIRGLRRTVSESAYAKRLRKLDAEFYDTVNDVVEELLGTSVEEFIEDSLSDPANLTVPTLDELRPGRVAVIADADGAVVDTTPFEVYEVTQDGTVVLRSLTNREVAQTLPLDQVRVLTGEADRTLNQIVRKAQMTALDTLLPTMSDAEAQSLFGASVTNLQQVLERLQRGQRVDQPFAKWLDQNLRKAKEGSGAWVAARAEMLSPEEAAAKLKTFAGDIALAAAADAYSDAGNPAYLDAVLDYLRERRDMLLQGNVTKRELVKSWFITAASQRASEQDVEKVLASYAAQGIDLRNLKGGVDFDATFVADGKIRPEEAAAAWLLTPQGQKFLDDYDQGVFAADEYEQMLRARKGAHGIPSVLQSAGSVGSPKNYGLQNIEGVEDVLAKINAAGGDPAVLNAQLQRLQVIADGKVGFVKHFLGLGDTPTVDARALEFWLGKQLTPEGLRALGFETKQAKVKDAFMSAGRVSSILRDRILERMQELRALGVGADLEPEVAAHILHHWIWDAVGDTPVTHEGLYSAMRLAQMPDGAQDAAAAGARSADEVEEARRLWEERGTESPYFKRWFGDSKVVDEEGQPLVVYHGTPRQLNQFDLDSASSRNLYGRGVSFSPDRSVAEDYSFFGGQGVGLRAPLDLTAEQRQIIADYARPLIESGQLRAGGPTGFDTEVPSALQNLDEFLAGGPYFSFERSVPSSESGFEFVTVEKLARESGAIIPGDVIESYVSVKKPLPTITRENGDVVPLLPAEATETVLRRAEAEAFSLTDKDYLDADILLRSDDGRLQYDFSDAIDLSEPSDPRQMAMLRKLNDIFYEEAVKLGYDGIIAKNELGTEIVVFDPTQVKSVYNRGTFDPGDARLLFQQDAPPIPKPEDITTAQDAVAALRRIRFVGGSRAEKRAAVEALRKVEEVIASPDLAVGDRQGRALFSAEPVEDNARVSDLRRRAQMRLNNLEFFVGTGDLPKEVLAYPSAPVAAVDKLNPQAAARAKQVIGEQMSLGFGRRAPEAETPKAPEAPKVEVPEADRSAARAVTDDKYVLRAREMFDEGKTPRAAEIVREAIEKNAGIDAAKAFIDEYNALRDAAVRARVAKAETPKAPEAPKVEAPAPAPEQAPVAEPTTETARIPKADRPREELVARYEKMSETSLVNLMGRRGLKMPEVGDSVQLAKMSDRERMIDALVADDLTPTGVKREAARQAAVEAKDYDQMALADLKAEVGARNEGRTKKADRIGKTASRKVLAERLRADDAAQAAARGEAPVGEGFVPATLPDEPNWGNARALRGQPVEVEARREVRVSDPLLDEDIVSYEPVKAELLRSKVGTVKVPRPYKKLRANYVKWWMRFADKTEEEAVAIADKIGRRRLAAAMEEDLRDAGEQPAALRRLLVTEDVRPVFKYEHNLDPSAKFDTPEEALADLNARLQEPEVRPASFDQVVDQLDEQAQAIIGRAIDKANEGDGTLNIATMRAVAPGVDDETLRGLLDLMRRTGVTGASPTPGRVALDDAAAEAARARIEAFFEPKARAERVAASVDAFERINQLDIDLLTRPELVDDEALRQFLTSLREASPDEYRRLVAARQREVVDEIESYEQEIVELRRMVSRLGRKVPTGRRKRQVRMAAIARAEKMIAEYQAAIDGLSDHLRRQPAQVDVDLAGIAGAARARRERAAAGVDGVEPPSPPSGGRGGVGGDAEAAMPKGLVYFINDASAILYAFRRADISTGLHEMSHVLRRQLDPEDLQTVLRWVNEQLVDRGYDTVDLVERPGGRLDFDFAANPEAVVEAEELFARAFERYLREGDTANSLLQRAFATMRDALMRIYAAIKGNNIDVPISPEMYDLFDKVFGASTQVKVGDLRDVQSFFDMQFALTRGGTRRLTARIAEQEQVEDTAEGSLRQFIASVRDYRARGFAGFIPDKLFSPDLTRGPVGSATGDRGFQLGPVSRRAMTLDEVTAAREAGEAPTALRMADHAAVAAASGFAMGVQALFVGGDAARLFRLVPPALRATMNGSAREVEEFMSELSMRLIDISRMRPGQRGDALHGLIQYARGRDVRMQTGAQRGQRARANFVDTEYHFVRQLRSFVGTLSEASREALAYDVSEVLNGRTSKWGALSGFWRGYAAQPTPEQLANAADQSFAAGLGLSEDISAALGATPSQRPMRVSELQQEMLGNVYGAISGTDGLKGSQISVEAERLGAEMLFLSGKSSVTVDGVVFTADDVFADATRPYLDWLFFGGEVEKDGAVLRLQGVSGITTARGVDAPSRAVGTLAMVMQSGYVAGVYDDMRKLGFGLSSTDARIVGKYLAGDAASMPLEDIARAKEIVRVFGRTTFDVSPASLGNFYVPREARNAISGQISMGLRQVGLQQNLEVKERFSFLEWALAYYQSMIIFGSVFQRQAFKMMSTQDLALGLGVVVGGPEGAAAAARASALTMLSALGGERIAEAAETAAQVASKLHGRPLSQGMFKARLREYVTEKGDEAVNTITDFFGASKFRVEVNPILENRDHLYVIGGRIYNARDLRKVFTQAGMYSNAFKEMRRDWWRNLFDERKQQELSPANRSFFDSAKEEVADFFTTGARRRMSTVFEHGVESADAWSDLERTGAAVTLMEFGYAPRDAARLVVEAVYDYRGSMTDGDRGWLRRILMPFWAFRKNANIQTMNFLASPEGAFRIRAVQKGARLGAESLTSVLYESMLQPYDVDISVMPPKVKDVYYQTRTILEMGYGGAPSQETLAEYREQLPPEQRGISDEELLDYSFDGWTIRDGFGGYANVPERFRIAFRAILSGNTSGLVRQQGGLYNLSDALAQQEVADFYVQMGGKMAARAAQGEGGLPAWAAKRPVVQVPLPEMTESAREILDYMARTATREGDTPDPGDSFYFVLPDNFVMSAVDHAGGLLATMLALKDVTYKAVGVDAIQGGEPPGISDADRTRLLNAFEPLVDVRDYGSPQAQLVARGVEELRGGNAKVRLHPITARLLEEGLSVPLPSSGGKSANLPGNAHIFRVLGATGGEVFADESRRGRFSRMVSRPVKVVARDAEGRRDGDEGFDPRSAKRSVEVVEGPFSSMDYTVPDSGPPGQERLAYQPYLYGTSAVWFPTTFLGQANKWLLDNVGDGPLEVSMLQDGSVANALLNIAIESYKLTGGRVMEADYGRTASMEQVRR